LEAPFSVVRIAELKHIPSWVLPRGSKPIDKAGSMSEVKLRTPNL
jgi:hypothetical protein